MNKRPTSEASADDEPSRSWHTYVDVCTTRALVCTYMYRWVTYSRRLVRKWSKTRGRLRRLCTPSFIFIFSRGPLFSSLSRTLSLFFAGPAAAAAVAVGFERGGVEGGGMREDKGSVLRCFKQMLWYCWVFCAKSWKWWANGWNWGCKRVFVEEWFLLDEMLNE